MYEMESNVVVFADVKKLRRVTKTLQHSGLIEKDLYKMGSYLTNEAW